MLKKYLPLISGFLLFATLLSLWILPSATPTLGIAILLFTVAVSVLSVFEKYKGSPVSRSKIIREVMKTLLIILIIVGVGGIAGLLAGRFAGAYVESRWSGMGITAGFVSAIITGFVVGYLVRWGMGKLERR